MRCIALASLRGKIIVLRDLTPSGKTFPERTAAWYMKSGEQPKRQLPWKQMVVWDTIDILRLELRTK